MGSEKPVRIVLASKSPRRRDFFRLLGLDFVADSSDADEDIAGDQTPAEAVRALSQRKARAVAARHPDALVVGADTIVVLDGEILGKPADRDEAVAMLRRLRGRAHDVLSGVTLILPSGAEITECAESRVVMRDYSEAEIAVYVDSGDPMDKAGAYAIQNRAFRPVAQIEGCYANVMGLPLCHLARAFLQAGAPLDVDVPALCRAETGYPCAVYPQYWPGRRPRSHAGPWNAGQM